MIKWDNCALLANTDFCAGKALEDCTFTPAAFHAVMGVAPQRRSLFIDGRFHKLVSSDFPINIGTLALKEITKSVFQIREITNVNNRIKRAVVVA